MNDETLYKLMKIRAALMKVKPRDKKISYNNALGLAAMDHCKCLAEGTCKGHVGPDGTFPKDRVAMYGTANGIDDFIVENVANS